MKLPKGARVIQSDDGLTLVDLPPHPKRSYPTWSIEALEKDIKLAEGRIESFKEAIAEQESLIEERKQNIALCRERDAKIAEWEKERGNLNL